MSTTRAERAPDERVCAHCLAEIERLKAAQSSPETVIPKLDSVQTHSRSLLKPPRHLEDINPVIRKGEEAYHTTGIDSDGAPVDIWVHRHCWADYHKARKWLHRAQSRSNGVHSASRTGYKVGPRLRARKAYE